MTDTLWTYALNELGAAPQGDTLTFTDSFGTRRLEQTPTGLRWADELTRPLIKTRRQLCKSLWREAGVNHSGLQEGEVLTALGAMRFSLNLHRERLGQPTMRLCLHLKRPVTFGGVRYTELHCTRHDPMAIQATGGRWAIREYRTNKEYDLSFAMRQMLYSLESRAADCLLTPQARQTARINEARHRLHDVQRHIQNLEIQARDIEIELRTLIAPAYAHLSLQPPEENAV